MSKAKVPSRGGDKITLEFGLVTIPVNLWNSVDETVGKIDRHLRVGDGHEVGYSKYDKTSGEVISDMETYKAYLTDLGVEVELTDEEVSAAMGYNPENPTATTLGIYPLSEFGKYLVSGNFQVRPQKFKIGTKTTRPFDKAFRLFMDALVEREAFLLVTYVGHGKPKLVAVFGDGTAKALHWANEVREDAPMPEPTYSESEKSTALVLVESLMGVEAPLPENEPVEKVREYANAKAAGQAPKIEEVVVNTAMADLTDLLSRSIEKAKAGKS